MKIAIHDYVGHPFQFELSKELAARGHDVFHLYCDTLEGGQASFDGDHGVTVVPVSAPAVIDKGAVVSRLRNEYAYGARLQQALDEISADVVVSANAPTHVQMQVQGLVRPRPWKNVLWVQDLYGVAIRSVYARRNKAVGAAVATPFVWTDRRLIDSADHVVVISEGFLGPTRRSADDPNVTVIENWSPLDEITPVDKDNSWSRAGGFADTFNYVYSGTLGMKHEPRALVALAEAVADRANVIVVASGVSMDWLRDEIAGKGLRNLHLIDPVEFEVLPQVLGTSDVLVVLLERDAGVFSVPSKVLSYLCAGRPILGSLPADNLARQIIEKAGAGVTVDPGDLEGFVEAAEQLHASPELRSQMADQARTYAESTFDIDVIADRWEAILESVVSPS